jgi:hypothetical protein
MSADRFAQLPDRPPTPSRRRVAVYYDRDGVIVTSTHLTVGTVRFPLDQLSELNKARGSTHPGVVVGIVIALAEPLAVAPLVAVVSTPVAWLVGAIALAVPCLVGVVCAQRWPAQHQLLARYQGCQVIVFSTRDSLEFGQVTRAIRRALEERYDE